MPFNRIRKEDIDDIDFVNSNELISDEYGTNSIYLLTTCVSTTAGTKTVVIDLASDNQGIYYSFDHPAQSGDIVWIFGTSGGDGDGYFTIDTVVDDVTFTINETFGDSTGGDIRFQYRSGASNVGYDDRNSNIITHNTVQGALRDLDDVAIALAPGDTFIANPTGSPAVATAVAGTTVAGAGLVYTTGAILSVGAGTHITVNANDVAVDVTTLLAAIDSTSIVVDSGTLVRAALTGAISAAQNSNATLFAGIRDNGASETDRTNLNFVSGTNTVATVTDDAGNDELEIAFNVDDFPLSGLADQAAGTLVANITGGAAPPTAHSLTTLAGGGLTYTNVTGIIAVGAGTHITVNANDVAVDVTTLLAAIDSTSIVVNSGTLERAALTGAIAASQNSNTTLFSGIRDNGGSETDRTNLNFVSGTNTTATITDDAANDELEISFSVDDFPLSGLADQAAGTIVANITGSSAAPTAHSLTTLAGGGLTYTNVTGIMAVGAGTHITVNANDVAVDVTTLLAAIDSTSIVVNSGTLERAAITGAIAITQNSNASLFSGIRDNGGSETDRTNLNFVSGTNTTAVITDDAANDELEIAVNVDDFPLTGLADQAAGTIVANITAGAAPPTAHSLTTLAGGGLTYTNVTGIIAVGAGTHITVNANDVAVDVTTLLAAIDSTSIVVNAGTLERAALTGAIVASQNSNATLFAGIRDNGSAENDRTNLNFVNGTNTTATITDDAGNDELEIRFNVDDLPPSALADQAAGTLLANITAGAAPPTAHSLTTLAGGGLTYTNVTGIMAVGAGTHITVNANDVALSPVNPGTTYGYQVDGAGTGIVALTGAEQGENIRFFTVNTAPGTGDLTDYVPGVPITTITEIVIDPSVDMLFNSLTQGQDGQRIRIRKLADSNQITIVNLAAGVTSGMQFRTIGLSTAPNIILRQANANVVIEYSSGINAWQVIESNPGIASSVNEGFVQASTSNVMSAKEMQRAALTGEVTASQNSNTTTVVRSTNFTSSPWTGNHTFNSSTFTVNTTGLTSITGDDVTITAADDLNLVSTNDNVLLTANGVTGDIILACTTTIVGTAGAGNVNWNATAGNVNLTAGADVLISATSGIGLFAAHTAANVDPGDLVLNATSGIAIVSNPTTPVVSVAQGIQLVSSTDVRLEATSGIGLFATLTQGDIANGDIITNAAGGVGIYAGYATTQLDVSTGDMVLNCTSGISIRTDNAAAPVTTVTAGQIQIEAYGDIWASTSAGGIELNTLTAGHTTAVTNGEISLKAQGTIALNTNTVQRLTIESDGSWNIGGSNGTTGQLLTTNGASSPPTWSNPGSSVPIALTSCNLHAPFVLTKYHNTGTGGAGDEIFFNANAPFDFRVIQWGVIVEAGINPSNIILRTATGGGGNTIGFVLTETTGGHSSNGLIGSTSLDCLIPAGGTLVARLSDIDVRVFISITCIRV